MEITTNVITTRTYDLIGLTQAQMDGLYDALSLHLSRKMDRHANEVLQAIETNEYYEYRK